MDTRNPTRDTAPGSDYTDCKHLWIGMLLTSNSKQQNLIKAKIMLIQRVLLSAHLSEISWQTSACYWHFQLDSRHSYDNLVLVSFLKSGYVWQKNLQIWVTYKKIDKNNVNNMYAFPHASPCVKKPHNTRHCHQMSVIMQAVSSHWHLVATAHKTLTQFTLTRWHLSGPIYTVPRSSLFHIPNGFMPKAVKQSSHARTIVRSQHLFRTRQYRIYRTVTLI